MDPLWGCGGCKKRRRKAAGIWRTGIRGPQEREALGSEFAWKEQAKRGGMVVIWVDAEWEDDVSNRPANGGPRMGELESEGLRRARPSELPRSIM